MKALLNALASECYCDAMLELLAKHRDRHMRYAWVTDWRTSYEFQRVLCADVDDEVAFEASEKVAQYDWDGGTWNNVDE